MAKYRKKPVVVDAIKFEPNQGIEDGYQTYETEYPEEGHGFTSINDLDTTRQTIIAPAIKTLEGWHVISPGDWIITGVAGERYPCKPHIFELTYERME